MSSYFYDRLTEPKDSSSKILPRESEKDSFNWAQVALGSDLYLAMSYLIPSNVPTFFQLCSCSPIKNIFLKKTNFQFFLLLLQISQENCFGVQFLGLKIVCIYMPQISISSIILSTHVFPYIVAAFERQQGSGRNTERFAILIFVVQIYIYSLNSFVVDVWLWFPSNVRAFLTELTIPFYILNFLSVAVRGRYNSNLRV